MRAAPQELRHTFNNQPHLQSIEVTQCSAPLCSFATVQGQDNQIVGGLFISDLQKEQFFQLGNNQEQWNDVSLMSNWQLTEFNLVHLTHIKLGKACKIVNGGYSKQRFSLFM